MEVDLAQSRSQHLQAEGFSQRAADFFRQALGLDMDLLFELREEMVARFTARLHGPRAEKLATTREGLAHTVEEAVQEARRIGFPVVLKGCSDKLTHKTELNMVKLFLRLGA